MVELHPHKNTSISMNGLLKAQFNSVSSALCHGSLDQALSLLRSIKLVAELKEKPSIWSNH